MRKPWLCTIDGSTRLAGVIGFPVHHTLSPAMHNAAFAALGINAVYLPLAVKPQDLRHVLRALSRLGALGVNLTIPHKQAALRIVDRIDDSARRIGAINTVEFLAGRLIGHNTDGLGFLASLRGVLRPRGRSALLLGAGGAGRAVAVALAGAGLGRLYVAETNPVPARRLLAHLSRLGFSRAAVVAPGSTALRAAAGRADLVINATPLGLRPADPLPLPPAWLRRGACVFDLAYGRKLTPWLAAARRRGCRIVPGWRMLLHQGAAAFRIWTGRTAPLAAMRAALRAAGVKD